MTATRKGRKGNRDGGLVYPRRSPFDGRPFAEAGAPDGELRPVPARTFRAAAVVRDATYGAGRREVAEALRIGPEAATNLLRRAEALGLVAHATEALARGGRRHVYRATALLGAYGEG